MVRVTDLLALPLDDLTLYHATDPYLSSLPLLIFHGPSTTTNSTLNSSRIQIHIFSAAGFQSYPRITISPNSPLYQAVDFLPRDRQGDEVYRGLAFGLLKYFRELPEVAKSGLIIQAAAFSGTASTLRRPRSAPKLFAEQHVADLVQSMVRVENIAEVARDIEAALRPQNIHHVDLDLVLPPGSISAFQELDPDEDNLDEDELMDPTLKQHGVYAPLVKLFGEVAFLPTSKLRRAPSRPTSLNRTRSFLKDQKMSLRREMGELVDTEERYVIKMHELVNHIAEDFRQKARDRTAGSFSPTEEALEKLFPKSLDRILAVNSAFLVAIQKVMDETEEDAMRDLEAPIVSSTSSRYGGTGRLKDPTGALAFAKVLLEWFPQFEECYQDYIRASQDFPQIITIFVKQQTTFSQRVQQTGEQRLRSAIIEPVQRLPRYSLFIDNIVNYLPVLHPALQPMLKARDIITSICSLDPPEADKPQTFKRLKNLVEAWPSTLHPRGRLITAVDFVELSPPFHQDIMPSSSVSQEGVFMLFADCIVVLKKTAGCSLSARGLMAEVDKPSAAVIMSNVTAAAGGQKKIFDLAFGGWHVLGDTKFATSDDGRLLSMISLNDLKDANNTRERNGHLATLRTFALQAAYDGKAAKFTEEIVRAKVEGRFSETERESDKWRLRSMKLPAAEIMLHTAVFEEGIDRLVEGRKEPAPIRIVVDHQHGTKGAPIGHYGVEIVAEVTMLDNAKYRLNIGGLHDRTFSDEVVTEHFLLIFVKRLNDLIRSQYHVSNPALTTPFISFYAKTLKSLQIMIEGDKIRSYRPASPVKMLTNLFSSSFNTSSTSINSLAIAQNATKLPRMPVLGDVPTLTRNNSNKSLHEVELKAAVTRTEDRPMNPLVRLEETFTGYIGALLSRKGNVVGKVLRNRATADELSINAIYNSFIENPFDQRAADEVSVDVLFVAFEKYLRMAWREQMGQVMTIQTLDALQEKAFKGQLGDFAEYVRMVFGEMAPQNRRAFIAIIKLLADLLDGCGNDADRGALTVAFAELLIVDGEPHDYINLLDRLVDDNERLFEDIGPGAMGDYGSNGSNSTFGSISKAGSKSATGSLTSNASSFRRRFADTLLRGNSKNEDRPPLWRTLSKPNRNVATGDSVPSSLSKESSINRSRSIESPGGRRPASRDRPTVLGAFDERPSSSSEVHRLSTIGASPPPEEKKEEKILKKKRRSSLSDLKTLVANATLGGSYEPSSDGKRASIFSSSPRTPSPTKIPVAGGIMDRNRGSMYRTGSPFQKSHSQIAFSTSRNTGGLTERPQNIMSNGGTAENGTIKDLWSLSPSKGHGKSASLTLSSSIPTLRGRAPSSSRPLSSPPKPAPQKLRLQSPQKLRERLQNEAKAINEAEASIRSELSLIGAEMAALNNAPTPAQPTLASLTTSLTSLESRLPELIGDLLARNEAIKTDLEKSLVASETKVKGLDQLYKEASAENELLYEKFNGELGKIVKAIKGKGVDGKEDLLGRVKESGEEVARVRRENARLRREVVTLRAVVKGGE